MQVRVNVPLAIALTVLTTGALLINSWRAGENRGRDVALRDGRLARDVVIGDVVEGQMDVDYLSARLLTECAPIQGEVRELWELYVRLDAERQGAREVVMWAEEDRFEIAGEVRRSQAFRFVRSEDTWQEDSGFRPCGPH